MWARCTRDTQPIQEKSWPTCQVFLFLFLKFCPLFYKKIAQVTCCLLVQFQVIRGSSKSLVMGFLLKNYISTYFNQKHLENILYNLLNSFMTSNNLNNDQQPQNQLKIIIKIFLSLNLPYQAMKRKENTQVELSSLNEIR